jgi:glycosyltransferase involved in cell wall biosynthesis
MKQTYPLRIALVHEWLDTYAGSERVLERLIGLFPQSDLHALVDFMVGSDRAILQGKPVKTSFIQRLPFARKRFRNYLGLMPIAVEQLSMAQYDLVVSSSHAVAKGVITGPGQVHVSYVHTPMRYAWDLQDQYLARAGLKGGLISAYTRWLLHRLRMWDVRTANGVDIFVANSSYIAERIRKVYCRDATVVYPPVQVDKFPLSEGPRDGYVVISRFVPYKRVDLVVEAFREMPHNRLTIVGRGPDEAKLKRLAAGAPNITFLPPQPHDELVRLLQTARAFVFAGEEDFGIGLAEAQACGTPLIAFGRGGARDIVRDDRTRRTGILFDRQHPASIIAAVRAFETLEESITPANCRANAMRFSPERFDEAMIAVIESAVRAAERRGFKATSTTRVAASIDDIALEPSALP